MPISTSYKTAAIRPDIVSFPGIVILAAGPIIDTAATITPGVTATRTGVGLYTLTYTNGVTAGFVHCGCTDFHETTGLDPLTIVALGTSGSLVGGAAVNLEISNKTGVLVDPEVGGGFCYMMTRLNTSVAVI